MQKYIADPEFLTFFGELLILSEPDGLGASKEDIMFPEKNGYIFLAQFTNGIRLDIQFLHLNLLEQYLQEDSLTTIIEDKSQLITTNFIASDKDYWQEIPSKEKVTYTITEFWWQYLNVLKSALRGQFFLAQFYLNLARDQLVQLITFSVATELPTKRSFGKKNDDLIEFLDTDTMDTIRSTYDTSSIEKIYVSLKAMAKLAPIFLRKLDDSLNSSFSRQLYGLKHAPITFLLSKEEIELAHFFKSID